MIEKAKEVLNRILGTTATPAESLKALAERRRTKAAELEKASRDLKTADENYQNAIAIEAITGSGTGTDASAKTIETLNRRISDLNTGLATIDKALLAVAGKESERQAAELQTKRDAIKQQNREHWEKAIAAVAALIIARIASGETWLIPNAPGQVPEHQAADLMRGLSAQLHDPLMPRGSGLHEVFTPEAINKAVSSNPDLPAAIEAGNAMERARAEENRTAQRPIDIVNTALRTANLDTRTVRDSADKCPNPACGSPRVDWDADKKEPPQSGKPVFVIVCGVCGHRSLSHKKPKSSPLYAVNPNMGRVKSGPVYPG